jgi:Tol biopolymer transport system component
MLVERPDLHILDADGSNDRLFLEDAGSPAWSPDGTRVAFVTVNEVGVFQVGVADLDGEVLWSEVPGTDPAWSPDGTKLAAEVYDGAQTWVHILDAASGDVLWELEGRFPDW